MSDLISREALRKRINKLSGKFWDDRYFLSRLDVMKQIDSAPTIDAVPVVKGEWVAYDNGKYFCSECDNEAYWDADFGQQLFDWCPCCGAYMQNGGA